LFSSLSWIPSFFFDSRDFVSLVLSLSSSLFCTLIAKSHLFGNPWSSRVRRMRESELERGKRESIVLSLKSRQKKRKLATRLTGNPLYSKQEPILTLSDENRDETKRINFEIKRVARSSSLCNHPKCFERGPSMLLGTPRSGTKRQQPHHLRRELDQFSDIDGK